MTISAFDAPDAPDDAPRNVFGLPLVSCGFDPLTGYFRDGCCRTDENDRGSHTVCSVVTAGFLAFSKSRGNDLTTPQPAFAFPGLKPGDRWCLCVSRWAEALAADCAPLVVLAATHERALDVVSLEQLIRHAVDGPASA